MASSAPGLLSGIFSQGAARDALGLASAAVVPIGTAGATIPLLNGSNTWSGPQYFGGAGYIELTAPNAWTGSSAAQASIHANYQINGTGSGGPGYFGIAAFLQVRSNIAAGSGNSTAVIWANNLGGPDTTGGLTGLVGRVALTEPSANTMAVEYVGVRGWSYAAANDGGVNGTPKGNFYGATFVAGLHGATFILNQSAAEFAVNTSADSSVAQKAGIFILGYEGDVVQGSIYDIGIDIHRYAEATSSSGWQVGLGFGNGQNFQPLSKLATAIKFWPSGSDSTTIANGIDFSFATITDFSEQWPNYSLSGAGAVKATSYGTFGSGNTTLDFISGGNGGFTFSSSDTNDGSPMLRLNNQTPGAAITTGLLVEAGAGTVQLYAAGTSANRTMQFIAAGSDGGYRFGAGSTNTVFIDTTGNLTSYALAAGFGADAGLQGAGTINAKNGFYINSSCTITSGSGAPSSTQPNGSIYLRTDGTINSRLYVSEGSGTWSAMISS